jgi:putative transposase
MRPRRLDTFGYVGFHAYSLTLCTFRRRPYFTNPDLVGHVSAQVLRIFAMSGFDIPAYCFMPDHSHFLVRGLSEHAHLPPVVRQAKQSTGTRFSRRWSGRLWQEGYYERVLRGDESVETVARYIEANPVRAGLAKTVTEWPFTGGSFLRPHA